MVEKIININDFTLILPILNESKNLKLLLNEIRNIPILKNIKIIVIDDNSDDRLISKKISKNFGVKYILRTKIKSLSASIIDSILYFETEYFIVMDADLQHNPFNIVDIIKIIQKEKSDLVIGCRDIKNLNFNFTFKRKIISNSGIIIANFFLNKKFKDPLTGFFCIKYSFFKKISKKLHYGGSKILFNILIFSSKITINETVINFRPRKYDSSKFKLNWHYYFIRVIFYSLIYRIFNIFN